MHTDVRLLRNLRKNKLQLLYCSLSVYLLWFTTSYYLLSTSPWSFFISLVSHFQSHQCRLRWQTSNCSSLLIYRPREDERLSWLSWLTCSRLFTHIVVTRRLKIERRTGSARWPKTGVPPTVLPRKFFGLFRPETVCSGAHLMHNTCNSLQPWVLMSVSIKTCYRG